MKTKELFDLIDMEKFNEDGMQMIIPIKEKFPIDETKTKDDFTVNGKIIIKEYGKYGSIPEDYEPFIEEYFKVCKQEDDELIDLRELSDGKTYYVHNNNNNVWLIINF